MGPTPLPKSALKRVLLTERIQRDSMRHMGLPEQAKAAASTLRSQQSRGRDKLVQAALSDEQIRSRLKLTARDLDVLDRAIHEKGAERNIGSRLLALKLKIAATVEPPTQRVSGDVQVQVVVNSLARSAYTLPAESTNASLPGAVDAE